MDGAYHEQSSSIYMEDRVKLVVYPAMYVLRFCVVKKFPSYAVKTNEAVDSKNRSRYIREECVL